MSSPCKLQINTAGAWRDVRRFDLDAVDAEALQVAAAKLVIIGNPSGRATLRIVTDNGLTDVLVHWDAKKGWVER